ncbi:MAG: hypothetical protein ACRDTT_09255, partial [Pseudonocardiaceae bacterium]
MRVTGLVGVVLAERQVLAVEVPRAEDARCAGEPLGESIDVGGQQPWDLALAPRTSCQCRPAATKPDAV